MHKSHDVSVIMYYLVLPTKYGKVVKVVFEDRIDKEFREVCLEIEIENRYEIKFLEIRTDKDYVHFLIQSVLKYSSTQIVTKIKSITVREIFRKMPGSSVGGKILDRCTLAVAIAIFRSSVWRKILDRWVFCKYG